MVDSKEPTYSYRSVEAALGEAFGADEKTIASLRGRLKGFQRDGLAPSAPGRGKVISYTTADAYDWGLALSLAEFGLSPRVVVRSVRPGTFQKYFLNEMQKHAGDERNFHLLMIFFPSLFYDELLPSSDPIIFTSIWDYRFDKDPSAIRNACSRYALIDVTDLKNRIDQALLRNADNARTLSRIA